MFVDGLGDTHAARLYALRVDNNTWELNVVVQAEQYAGGTAGVPLRARTFRLTFSPSTNQVVSVRSGTGPDVPGTTGTLMQGGQPGDGTGEGTPAFVVGSTGQAASLSITANFSAVSRLAWLRYADTPGTPTGQLALLSGTTFASGPAATNKQVARCADASLCQVLWNGTTNSWEGTQHRWDQLHRSEFQPLRDAGLLVTPGSDWELMSRTLQLKYGVSVSPVATPAQVTPSEADCGGPLVWDEAAVPAVSPDALVLVMDRSGSMKTPIDANATFGTGTQETRLAFAEAAARGYLDLVANRFGTAPEVGLVTFETTDHLDQNISKIITSGTPAAGEVTLNAFKTIVNGFVADGSTAIGAGLNRAGQMLQVGTFMAKAVILLSDGENNQQPAPLTVADDLASKGIRVFTVPPGRAADKKLLGDIAVRTGGAMFEAPNGDELPAIYAELFARSNGEALVLARQSVSVAESFNCSGGEFPCPFGTDQTDTPFGCLCIPPESSSRVRTIDINGEPTSLRLNVFMSVRNIDVDTWAPRFKLVDPAGVTRPLPVRGGSREEASWPFAGAAASVAGLGSGTSHPAGGSRRRLFLS
ncbi:MAG: VWA domain-containing protein [Polyangia bacterium]